MNKPSIVILLLMLCLGLEAQEDCIPDLGNIQIGDNLILHYTFNNGNATDQSVNGINGELNGPVPTSNRFDEANQALSFKYGDVVEVQHRDELDVQPPFSISVWAKRNTLTEGNPIFRTNFINDNYAGVIFGLGPNGGVGACIGCGLGYTGPGNRLCFSTLNTPAYEVNKWVHIVAVYESYGVGKIYINGCEVDTEQSGTGPPQIYYDGSPTFIGRNDSNVDPNVPNTFFNGSLDDLYFWDRIIAEKEVLFLYDFFLVEQFELDTLYFLNDDETLTLSVSDAFEDVTWSNGAIGNEATFDEPGMYTIDALFDCHPVCHQFEIKPNCDDTPTPEALMLDGLTNILCSGDSLTVEVDGPYDAFWWSNGTTGQSNIIDTPGSYFVIGENECKRDTKLFEIMPFQDTLSIDLGPDIEICGTEYTIDAGLNQMPVLWSTGDEAPQLVANESGVYVASLNTPCSTIQDTIEVVLHPEPAPLNLVNEYEKCPDDELIINLPEDFDAYALNQQPISPVFSLEEAGTYDIDFYDLCLDTTVTIVVSNFPTYEVVERIDTMICIGEVITLQSPLSQFPSLWNGSFMDAELMIDQGGSYVVEMSTPCQELSTTFEVEEVMDQSNIEDQYILCIGDTLSLQLDPSATNITWTDGSQQLNLSISEAGTYGYSFDKGKCFFQKQSIEVVSELCNNCEYYYPNVIALNSPMGNDEFFIRANYPECLEGLRYTIVDRWGSIIFESHAQGIWKGLKNGVPVSQGVYLVWIHNPTTNQNTTGTLTVLK